MAKFKEINNPIEFWRYSLLIVIPMLMMLGASYLVIGKFQKDIQFSQQEIAGLDVIEIIYDDVLLLQRLRGLRQLRIAGNNNLPEDIDEIASHLLSRMESSQESMPPYSHDVLNEIARDIKTMNNEADDTSRPLRQFQQYSKMIEKQLKLINEVSDNSNLTVDPRLFTNYMGQMLVKDFTRLTEYQGKIRGLTAYGIGNPRGFQPVAHEIAHLISSYHYDLKVLNRNVQLLNTVDNRENNPVLENISEWQQVAAHFVTYADNLLTDGDKTSSATRLFNLGTEALDKNYTAYQSVINELIKLLQDRVNGLRYALILIIGAGGVGMLLLIAVSIMLYRRNQNSFANILVAKEKADSANKAKSVFLSRMSHEFRTPLHGILSFSRFGIKRIRTASRDKLLQYFTEVDESGRRMLTLVEGLLDFSKMKAGKMVYRFEDVDITVLIKTVLNELAVLIEENNSTIRFQCHTQDTVVSLDKERIMQVLRNLIYNGLKFSPTGSSLYVEVNSVGDELKVIISDEGVGIPDGELDMIFDPFIQSSETDNGSGGTGLGLAISKEIVEAGHQGHIYAINKPEAGASLIFTLPRKIEKQICAFCALRGHHT